MKRGWETITTGLGRKESISETMLTTSGIRFIDIDVPVVFVLEWVVIVVLLKKKTWKQTMTSRIAQWAYSLRGRV
jgi:hypothetical protein